MIEVNKKIVIHKKIALTLKPLKIMITVDFISRVILFSVLILLGLGAIPYIIGDGIANNECIKYCYDNQILINHVKDASYCQNFTLNIDSSTQSNINTETKSNTDVNNIQNKNKRQILTHQDIKVPSDFSILIYKYTTPTNDPKPCYQKTILTSFITTWLIYLYVIGVFFSLRWYVKYQEPEIRLVINTVNEITV